MSRSRVELELDLDGDTLSGRLCDGAGEVPFEGWLTLVAALEAARVRARQERAGAQTPTGKGIVIPTERPRGHG